MACSMMNATGFPPQTAADTQRQLAEDWQTNITLEQAEALMDASVDLCAAMKNSPK
jgi:hypothetical protein